MFVCLCVGVGVCVFIYIYIDIYLYIYIYIYIYIHTQTHTHTLFTLHAPLLWINTTCLDITLLPILWLHFMLYWYRYLLA